MESIESISNRRVENKRIPNIKDELKTIETAPTIDDFDMPFLLEDKYQQMSKEEYVESFKEMEEIIKKAENMEINESNQDWKNILEGESIEYGGSHKVEWLKESFQQRLRGAKERLEILKKQIK